MSSDENPVVFPTEKSVSTAESAGDPEPSEAGSDGTALWAAPSAIAGMQDAAGSGIHDLAQEAGPSSSPTEALRPLLEAICGQLAELRATAAEGNRLSEQRERIVDRLHEEVTALRAGELQQAMLPVFRELVRLYDDLGRAACSYQEDAGGAARDLGIFRQAVEDALYRQGVEPYTTGVGELFDGKTQRALAAIPTPDAARDRTVARVVRIGFRTDTKIVRMLEVEVYRHVPASPANADASLVKPVS